MFNILFPPDSFIFKQAHLFSKSLFEKPPVSRGFILRKFQMTWALKIPALWTRASSLSCLFWIRIWNNSVHDTSKSVFGRIYPLCRTLLGRLSDNVIHHLRRVCRLARSFRHRCMCAVRQLCLLCREPLFIIHNTGSGAVKETVAWDFLSCFFMNQHLIGPWWMPENIFEFYFYLTEIFMKKTELPQIIRES